MRSSKTTFDCQRDNNKMMMSMNVVEREEEEEGAAFFKFESKRKFWTNFYLSSDHNRQMAKAAEFGRIK